MLEMAGIRTNIPQILSAMKAGGGRFSSAAQNSVMENGKLVMKECMVQIDALIYSTPPSPSYRRTKNLRRSHHMKKIAPMAVLIYNDAQYSGWVHDGTYKMAARPWMERAIANTIGEQKNRLTRDGLKAFQGD